MQIPLVLEGVEIWVLTISLVVALAVLACGMIVKFNAPLTNRLPPQLPTDPGWGGWRVSTMRYDYVDLILIGLLVFLYTSPIFMQAVGQFYPEEKPEKNPEIGIFAIAASIVFQFVITGLIVLAAARHRRISDWLGLKWKLWPIVFLVAPVGVFATWMFAGGLEVLKVNDWLREQLGVAEQQDVVKAFTDSDSYLMLGLLSFMAVIVAPITEEILFRGYLYPVAKRYAGSLPAIIFSSLIFAAIHNSTIAFLPLLFLAVIMALSYEFTGSIIAPIAIHMLFNSMTVLVQIAQKMEWITLPES